MKILHNLSEKTVFYISIVLLGILTLSSFFCSYYAEDMGTQVALAHGDNILLQIIIVGASLGAILLLFRLPDRMLAKLKKILVVLAPAYMLFAGLFLVVFGRTAPAADAYSVYALGEVFAEGNLAAIQPTGDTYLSFYPQQIGLIGFYEIICRLWNILPISTPAYHIIKCINVAFACLIVIYQYRTVHILSKSDKADIMYLILAMCNLPLLFYTSFVYGEIPSFAMVSIGIFYLLQADERLRKSEKPYLSLLFSLLSLTLGVMLRKNSLIIIIAVVLAVGCRWLLTRKHVMLLYAAILVVCAVGILPLTQKVYELRADNHLLSGVPAASYFAMGMQEADRGNGWYNGFNFETYQETGLDTKATVAVSQAIITDRISYFWDNPLYAIQFYANKFLSQWTDGSYACRQATIQTFTERLPFLQSMYDGNLAPLFAGFCNSHQLMVYIGAFLFLLQQRKKEASPWTLLLYIGFIGVIGGALFHTIWEANSRYILAYGLLLVPYGAMGLGNFHFHPKHTI